jgi:hypothetical protein
MEHRRTVFLRLTWNYFATQLVDQGLHAVTDTQHGQITFEDPVGYPGSARVVNAGRAAREDNALGVDVANRLPGAGSGKNLGIDFELSDAAGDKVAVLRAEVDDDYALID